MKYFRKTIRVKPSASRQKSAEIYYICLDYDNSLDPVSIKTKEMLKRLDKYDRKTRMAEEEAEETGKKPKLSVVDEDEGKALFDELE